MDWNKKIKVGRSSMTLKNIYFSVPLRYEKRLHFVDQREKGIYVFLFKTQSLTVIQDQIKIKGLVNEKPFYITHSKKMIFLFRRGQSIKLRGSIFQRTCFFPDSYDVRVGLVPIYYNLSHLIGKVIEENPIDNESLSSAFNKIHFPKSYEQIIEGFDKLFLIEIACILHVLKSQQYKRPALQITNVKCDLIPNNYQQKVIQNIYKYLQNDTTMNCILYGDVGAGKTLVAFFIAIQFIQNEYSVAFLVPTGVLAQQVYEVLLKWTPNVELVVRTTKKITKEKKIYVGTHALLFRELPPIGLLIIDEQHKFGVHQRNYLFHKNECDVLMMTATPIPRTFSMITSGLIKFENLQCKSINNHLILTDNREETLQKALEIAKNNIVFWIINNIEKVEEFTKELQKKHENIYMVHSGIKEKSETLTNITKGLLISTTVVEVGIDLNVSMIIVENANNFGISQLHQLWGRVGRRGTPGTMILLDKPTTKLKEFSKTTSGWERSQLDRDNRGAGTLHNVLQAGQTEFWFGFTLNETGEIIKKPLTTNIVEQSKTININDEYISLFAISNSL